MISEKIKDQINEALKAGDEVRVSTLRMLSSELHNRIIDKRGAGDNPVLSEEEELDVVKKEVKKRKDAIEIYEKANEKERAEAETKELKILQEYLPAELADDELEKIVEEVITSVSPSGPQDFGKVMGAAMGKIAGRASGDRVSAIVRSKLS